MTAGQTTTSSELEEQSATEIGDRNNSKYCGNHPLNLPPTTNTTLGVSFRGDGTFFDK